MQVRLRIFIALFLAAMVFSLAVTPVARAHGKLVKAVPAPGSSVGSAPSQVQLWFDEQPELSFSEVQVLNSQKERVDTGTLQLAPDDNLSLIVPLKGITDGTYTVVWKILSQADGHITRGVFAFNVGNVAGPVTAPIDSGGTATYEANPASATARWLSLLSLLTIVGAFFFRAFLLNRSLDAVDANNSTRRVSDKRWLQLISVAFVLFFVGNLAELALQVQLVAEQVTFTAVVNVLTTTRFGTLWLLRVGLMIVAAVIVMLMTRRVNVPMGESALIVLGNVALFTRSLLGHSVGIGDGWLPVFADWLHLLAISIWVGGLFVFAWVMPFMWRSMDPIKRSKWVAWLVPQFSIVAIGSTLVIAITGIYNSRVQIPALDKVVTGDFGAFENLFADPYTAALALKVALFLVMIAFGALNLLLISPRFREYVTQPDKSAGLFSRFRLTVAGEVLLGIGVIFLAGLLTLTPPPRSTPTELAPSVVEQNQTRPLLLFGNPISDVGVQLEIGPNAQNPEQLVVRTLDPQGNPLGDIQRVILQLMYLDEDQGLQNVNAEPSPDGSYVLNGNYFPLDGMWRVRVTVRQQGKEDAVTDFSYYRPPANAASSDVALARLQLQNAEAQMNQLTALRSRQELNDGTNAVVVSEYEYLAPDKTRFVIQGQGEAIAIGGTQYLQTKDQLWNERARIEPFVFPKFDFAQTARNVRFGRTETINGIPAQIVRFETPNTVGDEMVQYAYWIAQDDARVLQFAMAGSNHYMIERFRDFDGQDIAIAAPTNIAPAPTSAPVASTQGNDAITRMVVASPRPRGIITGDLEGDGALVLVVAGVVLLVVGGGKRQRNIRLTILGVGAACVILGVGLFIDAVNGTINANASAPTNLARATPGQLVYQQNCQACHGEKGLGDGPGAAALPVKPFDLTTHFFQHDEAYHFQTILNGRGYMPSFGPRLSQDQIIDVVAYVRLLAQQARQQGGGRAPGFTPQAPLDTPTPVPPSGSLGIPPVTATQSSPTSEVGSSTASVAQTPATKTVSGLDQTRVLGDVTASVKIEPHVFQPTKVEVQLNGPDGLPATNIERVGITIAMEGMNHGVMGIEAVRIRPGLYRAEGMLIGMAGPSLMALRVKRNDGVFESSVFPFRAGDEEASGSVARMYSRPSEPSQIEDIAVYPKDVLPREIQVQAGRPVRLEIMYVDQPFCAPVVAIPDLGLQEKVSAAGVADLEFIPKQNSTLEIVCEAGGLELRKRNR